MIDLRALTLIRPMAAAIVHGTKRIENRPLDLPKAMRGVPTIVGVHAGKGYDPEYSRIVHQIDYREWRETTFERYCVTAYEDRLKDEGLVGLMLLTGRVFTEQSLPIRRHTFTAGGIRIPECDPWWGGPFGYEIADAIAFKEPIACKGMLGFWRLPDVHHGNLQILEGLDTLRSHTAFATRGAA